MLEVVFTILPTFALIFGLTDVGFMIFRWSTLQNAVREGVRYAITFQTEPDPNGGSLGQDASVKQVVEHYSLGMVSATDDPAHIFVNYYSPSDPNTPITNGGNSPGNVVEVSVQNISFSWLAPISGVIVGDSIFWATEPLTISVYAADILGGLPVGVNEVPR